DGQTPQLGGEFTVPPALTPAVQLIETQLVINGDTGDGKIEVVKHVTGSSLTIARARAPRILMWTPSTASSSMVWPGKTILKCRKIALSWRSLTAASEATRRVLRPGGRCCSPTSGPGACTAPCLSKIGMTEITRRGWGGGCREATSGCPRISATRSA